MAARRRSMIRGLIAAGSALVIIGAGTLFWLLVAIPRPDLAATAGAGSGQGVPSLGWSLLAGLALAAGVACLGIGVNRWYQYRPRTIQRPPDDGSLQP